MQLNSGQVQTVSAFGFYVLLTLLFSNAPFFWDTILTSTVATHFYTEGIGTGIAPLAWDAGHPTFFQMYLSGVWKLFGRSLAASHFAMLPFLLLMGWTFTSLSQLFIKDIRFQWIALIFFLLHPFILTQSTLVSYDILQVAFFLLALLAALRQQALLFALSIAGLCMLSIRGQIMATALIAGFALLNRFRPRQLLPALVLWLIFVPGWHLYHYSVTGWMLLTPSTSWASQRDAADFQTLLSNLTGMARGFADYGTLALSLLTAALLMKHHKRMNSDEKFRQILILSGLSLMVLVLSILPFSNPAGHRYWMPFHAVSILCAGYLLQYVGRGFPVAVIALVLLASGHFFLYPAPLSNGWDVVLTHLPYHNNRKEALKYLEQRDVKLQNVGTAFPLFCSLEQTDLLPGERLQDISEISLTDPEHVLYSPVCNDMRHIYGPITESMQLEKVWGKGLTRIELYSKSKADL